MKRLYVLVSVVYVVLVILILEVLTTPNENSQPTVSTSEVIPTLYENENLLEQIHSFAHKNSVKPIDAKVDPIWKAIPGYNGLEADIEASYLNMWPDDQFNEDLMIYNEVSPNVHLADLPPSPIYRGNPEKPMVTLLINVAWGNEFIEPILNTLKKHGVQATFFFDGSWVKANPDIAKKIYNDKHEIGNHAYSHPDLKSFTRNKTFNEMKKTNDIIEETLNVTPKWFAPPSGSFKDETVQIAHELNMFTILWTVDTVDWKKPETNEMVNRVVSKVHNGAMILMHPTKPVAEGLDKIIQQIKQQGYQIGTVSEMMDEQRIIQDK